MRHQYLSQYPDHPEEDKVLLMLDDELNIPEAEVIRIHLQQCRPCYRKMLELRKGMNVFLEFKTHLEKRPFSLLDEV
jgi:hypothetical protein